LSCEFGSTNTNKVDKITFASGETNADFPADTETWTISTTVDENGDLNYTDEIPVEISVDFTNPDNQIKQTATIDLDFSGSYPEVDEVFAVKFDDEFAASYEIADQKQTDTITISSVADGDEFEIKIDENSAANYTFVNLESATAENLKENFPTTNNLDISATIDGADPKKIILKGNDGNFTDFAAQICFKPASSGAETCQTDSDGSDSTAVNLDASGIKATISKTTAAGSETFYEIVISDAAAGNIF
jgi:hypothetical protein